MFRKDEFPDRDRPHPAFTPGYTTSVQRAPRLKLRSSQNASSEITGARFGHGQVLDGNGRCRTLIAPREMRHGAEVDRFGIYLRGASETVHFDA